MTPPKRRYFMKLDERNVKCNKCFKILKSSGNTTNLVVTIWEYNKKQVNMVQTLNGHIEAVTCLAASSAYNVIVSGSRDATAIIWDLSHRIFVRQLTGHNAPVAAVAINDLTATSGGSLAFGGDNYDFAHIAPFSNEAKCFIERYVLSKNIPY